MCHRGSTEAKLRYALRPRSQNRSRGLELLCDCPNAAPKEKKGKKGARKSVLMQNEWNQTMHHNETSQQACLCSQQMLHATDAGCPSQPSILFKALKRACIQLHKTLADCRRKKAIGLRNLNHTNKWPRPMSALDNSPKWLKLDHTVPAHKLVSITTQGICNL